MIAYPTIDTGGVASPGLWVDRAAVQRNIDQMIEDVGGTEQIDRLRPHMKTHKMGEVISMQKDDTIIILDAEGNRMIEEFKRGRPGPGGCKFRSRKTASRDVLSGGIRLKMFDCE